ncbi:hypothetical protein AX15_007406 [Amanita polypyramis BW_CC]|nr:hypothetical protein AX15_007406 [Amanita polypyramis BW_CC]
MSVLVDLLSDPLVQQIAPLIVLLLTPAFVLLFALRTEQQALVDRFVMGLEALSALAPWNWLSSTGSGSNKGGHHSHQHHRHGTRKLLRTRADQQAARANGSARPDKYDEFEGYYPGLVNISGTYCFMNSTLQALASLSYLQPHIDAIHEKAELLDVPTPVIDTLQHLFRRLNTPRSSYHSIRPVDIIQALTNVEGRTNALFYSREHQDAQELFQLLSECLKNEITAVDKEGKRDRGLGDLSQNPETARELGKSVFDGLTANRRSCVKCEYTEAVMHFALDNLQLSLPRHGALCRLEDCLEEYTRLEILRDCVCRKCSLVETHRRLQLDLAMLEEATKSEGNPSNSRKRRLKELRRMEARVRSALQEGRIEEDLKDVRMERIISPATKQAMIARPPAVLALHINRSIHYGHYASKNSIRLIFPEILDITQYTTSGNLSLKPTLSISTPPPSSLTTSGSLSSSTSYSYPRRSRTPTRSTYSNVSQHHVRTLYRLSAVVCHYGQHSFGHYVCYRRRPRTTRLSKEKRWAPPRLVDPLLLHELDADGKEEMNRDRAGLDVDVDGNRNGSPSSNEIRSRGADLGGGPEMPYVWDNEDPSEYGPGTGKGWLRISDDAVRECGIESVLAEGSGAFMLYYERVVVDVPGVYPSRTRSRSRVQECGPLRTDGRGEVGESAGVVVREDGDEGRRTVIEPGRGHEEEDRSGEDEDGDGDDSVGRESEETLRPRTKTIVMNGDVDTLVSEVGVGVMSKSKSSREKQKDKGRPIIGISTESSRSTSSFSTAGSFRASSIGQLEPRIIRSVEAGRKRSITPSVSNASSSGVPSPVDTDMTTSTTRSSSSGSFKLDSSGYVFVSPRELGEPSLSRAVSPAATTTRSGPRSTLPPTSSILASTVSPPVTPVTSRSRSRKEARDELPNGVSSVFHSHSNSHSHSHSSPSPSHAHMYTHMYTQTFPPPTSPSSPSHSPTSPSHSPTSSSSSPPSKPKPNTLKRKSRLSANGKKASSGHGREHGPGNNGLGPGLQTTSLEA